MISYKTDPIIAHYHGLRWSKKMSEKASRFVPPAWINQQIKNRLKELYKTRSYEYKEV